MRIFAEKPKTQGLARTFRPTLPGQAHFQQNREVAAILRQVAPAPNPTITSVLTELTSGALGLHENLKWSILANNANHKTVSSNQSSLFSYFQTKINSGLFTFETVTEDQRTVFNYLDPATKEILRKAAIQKSKLFQGLTAMQVSPGKTASQIATERMNATKSGDYYPNSLAAQFADYHILPDMLVAEVTPGSAAANKPMVNYVLDLKKRYGGDHAKVKNKLVKKTWFLACGLGNLFAMAVSRNKAVATVAGAKTWLKKMVLDVAPTKALVQVSKGRFDLHINPVLSDLSASGKAPKKTSRYVPLTRKNSVALFQKGMKQSAGQLDTRLGIVQGKGSSYHMYIVYKDLDGVWRTMDMYMSIGDRPGGGLPHSAKYATKMLWNKLVID